MLKTYIMGVSRDIMAYSNEISQCESCKGLPSDFSRHDFGERLNWFQPKLFSELDLVQYVRAQYDTLITLLHKIFALFFFDYYPSHVLSSF